MNQDISDVSIVQTLYDGLSDLPSQRFKTVADCEVFVAKLQERGIRPHLLLSEARGTRSVLKALLGAGLEPADLGVANKDELLPYMTRDIAVDLEKVMSDVRPALVKLILGEIGLTQWRAYQVHQNDTNVSPEILQFLDQLQLPQIGRSGIPSLLLHDLGASLSAEVLQEATQLLAFTTSNQHKYLLDASGSGKTRLCLEAMCQQYAFYFTFADPNGQTSNIIRDVVTVPDIGSRDLPNVYKTLSDLLLPFHERDLDAKAYTECQELRQRIGGKNSNAATYLLVRVLAARLYLFDQYLRCAASVTGGQLHTTQCRRAWMYLQVQPNILGISNITDIFVTLVDCLRGAGDDFVASLCDQCLSSIPTLLGSDQWDLPIVIDEAFEGLARLPSAFLSSLVDHSTGLPLSGPLLWEVTACWSQLSPAHLVVTGDGFSSNDLRLYRSSPLAQGAEWTYVGPMTSFRTREQQYGYIKSLLPLTLLQSEHGKVLCNRMWYWLRGRYRITASFIQDLLARFIFDAYKANVYLNMFLFELGEFRPLDSLYPNRLEHLPEPSVTQFEFGDLDPIDTAVLRNKVDCILRGVVPPPMDQDTAFLLQLRFGEIAGVSVLADQVVVYEPSLLAAASTWFDNLARQQADSAQSDEQISYTAKLLSRLSIDS